MKKRLLMLCFAFLLLPAAWAQKNYETTYKLTCGPTEVTLTNTCTMLTKYQHFCSKQKLEFFNAKTSKKTEQKYLPKPIKDDLQIFTAQLICLKNRGVYYIRTSNIASGGCSNCEWEDIFDANGKYIGSNKRGFANALSKPFKWLPDRFFDIFDYDNIIDSINIFMTPQKQE